MYIKFLSIESSGFQSLSDFKLDLCNRGVVLVKGKNRYEEHASSNGSGKSSCFEAIMWAIYGKTSAGISDPSNRYIKNGCSVSVDFMVDETVYSIVRTLNDPVKKNSLVLMRNGQDISGRNKTDTEKIIQNDVMPFSQDIFLSTVFLSQGFSNRLSTLNPSGRKERLESLTHTSVRVESFKQNISNIRDNYSSIYNNLNSDIRFIDGSLKQIEQEISRLEKIISDNEKDKPNIDINKLDESLSKLKDLSYSLDEEYRKRMYDLSEMKSSKMKKEFSIKELKSEIIRIDKEIEDITNSICPTCGQKINNDHIDERKNELLERKLYIENDLSTEQKLIDDIDVKIKSEEDILGTLSSKLNPIKLKINQLESLIKTVNSFKDTTSDKDRLVEIKSKIVDLNKEKTVKISERDETQNYLDTGSNIMNMITKQFRSYLLNNTADYMNERLFDYSNILFSGKDDVVKIVIDSSKLDIYLGNALYDTLSGGEKRKVDLAIVLAQRDLAMGISGSTSNILILDEVFDNLDDKAIGTVASMFSSVSSEIDSMFIISHKPDVEIPYDDIITVEKGTDRISHII